jgi:hypothetical protein
METFEYKMRIIVLWILSAISMSAHMILMSIDPAASKKLSDWAATAAQGEWLITALFWLVPLWFAFLSVLLKGESIRWINLIMATLFTLLNIWHFFICGVPLLDGPYAKPVPHHVMLVGSTIVATAMIAWYAWKWPKQES